MAAVRLRRDRNTCRCWTLRRGKSPLSAVQSIHMRRWHEVAGILISVHNEMLQIRSTRAYWSRNKVDKRRGRSIWGPQDHRGGWGCAAPVIVAVVQLSDLLNATLSHMGTALSSRSCN